MQEELNTTLGNAGKKASKVAKNVMNKAENLEGDTMGTARQMLGNVTDAASEYLSTFNTSPLGFVRQYPVQAALGGVVLGFILGAAVSRKSVTE